MTLFKKILAYNKLMDKKKSMGMKIIIAVIVIGVAGGFFFVLNEVSNLRQEVKNLEMNADLSNNEITQPGVPSEKKEATSTDVGTTPIDEEDVIIPTAILFETRSSPLLLPQTDLNVAIQRVSKENQTGVMRIYLKVYTSKADSYSALEVGNLFEIINPNGKNQKPLKVRGQFDSMPPESSVTGEVVFKVSPEQNSVVIQIESKEGITYYEFNFEEENYREATLG